MSREFEEAVLKKLDILDKRTNDTDKNVRELREDFAVFDFEINRKIDTLFDANTVNQEKHDFFQEKISSLEAIHIAYASC